MKSIAKLEQLEKRRIQEELARATPGSDEYTKLLKAREQLEDISAKRRAGHIKAGDVMKVLVSVGTTIGVISADAWIPAVASKLRIQDMISKMFK